MAPPLPDETTATLFHAAFHPPGHPTFVDLCELPGGALVALPPTRNPGLLVPGPIIPNILAYHLFITGGEGLLSLLLLSLVGLALCFHWVGRGQSLGRNGGNSSHGNPRS